MAEPIRRRLLLQYLEPSPAVITADPEWLRDHLASALDRLPVTDLALGWELEPHVVEAIRPVVPSGVTVWRWVPVFTDPGDGITEEQVAVGPDRIAPPPFRDLADFRFLCLDQDEVVEGGLERTLRLGREIDADGVLLDRIRWHSPSTSPAAELTCFCPRSRARAADDGLDLDRLGQTVLEADGSLGGRRQLVETLLGRSDRGPITRFLDWRSATVTRAVRRVSDGLREAGFRSALDVFTPALSRSVGQDLAALGELGGWSKSMTYFEALGPASMPFELRGYADWLEAAGEPDAGRLLAGVLGFEPPGLTGRGPQLAALRTEQANLAAAVGPDRAVVGIDAVEIPGVCEVAPADLAARVASIRAAGLGLSPCWELLFMGDERVSDIAGSWG